MYILLVYLFKSITDFVSGVLGKSFFSYVVLPLLTPQQQSTKEFGSYTVERRVQWENLQTTLE